MILLSSVKPQEKLKKSPHKNLYPSLMILSKISKIEKLNNYKITQSKSLQEVRRCVIV